MKKLLLISSVILVVFLIYLTTIDRKVYYLALGDSIAVGLNSYNIVDYGYTDYIKDYLEDKNILERYVNQYAKSGYRITDVYRDIEDNKKVNLGNKEITLKNALIKADLVTLSIGANDFLANFDFGNFVGQINTNQTYEYIDEISSDLDKLLKTIRSYCKEDIILIGYYNPLPRLTNGYEDLMDSIFSYSDEKYETVCDKYDITYISVYDLFKGNTDYLPNPLNIHPSKEGYEAISELVIKEIDNSLLK